jgi:hypothetical protein
LGKVEQKLILHFLEKWSKNYSAAHSNYYIKNTFTFIKYSSQKE